MRTSLGETLYKEPLYELSMHHKMEYSSLKYILRTGELFELKNEIAKTR